MVFSSIPAYLDPSNWHPQQQQNHQIIGSGSPNPNPLFPPPPPPPPQHGGGAVGGAGSIRPGSMSERARLANIPMPETALKCPRCESTNTKFCYFNNYSLSQPRHFCKTCRRYWTRGGALRNVPVGGGCRRNKRSKSSSAKSSPASSERLQGGNPSSSTGASAPPQLPPLRFTSPLSQLTDGYSGGGDVGLSYGGMTAGVSNEMNFHGGGGGGIEQWRMQQFQQFPFLGGGLEAAGMYGQFHHGGEAGFMGGGGGGGETSHELRPKLSTASMMSQMAAVKTEDRNPERRLLGGGGGMAGNEQWNPLTVNWTELSSFSTSSSTTNNPL